MKILILEDNLDKENKIKSLIKSHDQEASIEIFSASHFTGFATVINDHKYDLIIADLIVPCFPDDLEAIDVSSRIVDVARRDAGRNLKTPILALTAFDSKAEDHFRELNSRDIVVITYSEDDNNWEKALTEKLDTCRPSKRYGVVIICALPKEAAAFAEAGYKLGSGFVYNGLQCRELTLANQTVLLVTAPKMGLVTAAIITTKIIEWFHPKLVCMSGICAGIDGSANIYDTIVFDNCYQHDYGKWTDEGFKTEIFTIQLDSTLRASIQTFIDEPSFKVKMKENVHLNANEYPTGTVTFDFDVKVSTSSSSGNAVVANETAIKNMTEAQRKLMAFDMESFAVYESARVSGANVKCFCVKAVVDNGILKSDHFHRVACILSARAVCQLLESIELID